jgi:hypothetical protein
VLGMSCQEPAWFTREEGYRGGAWGMLAAGELWSRGGRHKAGRAAATVPNPSSDFFFDTTLARTGETTGG